MIKQAFLFDSLIKDIDIYKNIANTQKSYIDQLNVFREIREKAVEAELEKNIKLYKDLIDNIILTDISGSFKEKIKIIEKYFIRDFYETPVYYCFHLLHFNLNSFVKNSVKFINVNNYIHAIKENGTVILNPLHTDLYQILTNYLSLIDKNIRYSLYGPETSLEKIEKINKLYTPSVNNFEYNYIIDNNGFPFPLILRKALEDIKQKKVVAILPEFSMGLGPQHTVHLLGRKVSMPMGSSWLSTKMHVPIILVHTEMTSGYKIRITFEDPVYPSKEVSKDSIIEESKRVFAKIDAIIRENPYSWCGYDSFANMLVKH